MLTKHIDGSHSGKDSPLGREGSRGKSESHARRRGAARSENLTLWHNYIKLCNFRDLERICHLSRAFERSIPEGGQEQDGQFM